MQTIVFIHGMWVDEKFWGNYIDFFKCKYNCVAITLPCHGSDNDKVGNVSLRRYVNHCENEIKKLNLSEKPIIIGHSMGGLIAQKLASTGFAKKAVYLSTAAPSEIFGLTKSVVKSFKSGLLRWVFWKKPFLPTFDEAVYSMLHLLTHDQQKEFYNSLVSESGRAASEIGFWMFDPHKSSVVGKIKCPILVISGSQDRITPASVVRKIARKYSADYMEFPNHAHSITKELGWEKVAKHIDKWLAKNKE